MPKKIRELRNQLRKAGFTWKPGKGSHGSWSHPLIDTPLTISGKDGADAQIYQEKLVKDALRQIGGNQ